MPNSRTYLDYLNEKIDISPANSQEELEAAELVRSLMDEHGLETTVQDFTVPAAGDLPHNVLYVVMFLGMLLSGILGSAVGLVGLLLVIAALALLVAEFSGHDLLGRLGPAARSQNVIGVHRATGPLVVKGNRPIVIVAHYDSPNEGLLYQPQLARYQVPLRRARFLCVIVVSVLSLLQAMPFLPTTARHVLWVLGILASLPLLIVGVSTIYARFAPCTTGANDNKASIAAMLGVMDAVRPAGDEAKRYMELHPHTEPEPEPVVEPEPEDYPAAPLPVSGPRPGLDLASEEDPASPQADGDIPSVSDEGSSPVGEAPTHEPPAAPAPMPSVDRGGLVDWGGVRRGPELMQSLNILPPECEIVYQEPPVPKVDPATLPEIPRFTDEDFADELNTKYGLDGIGSTAAPSEEGSSLPDGEPPSQTTRPERHTGYVPSFFSQAKGRAEHPDTRIRLGKGYAGKPAQDALPSPGRDEYPTFDEDYLVAEYEVIEDPTSSQEEPSSHPDIVTPLEETIAPSGAADADVAAGVADALGVPDATGAPADAATSAGVMEQPTLERPAPEVTKPSVPMNVPEVTATTPPQTFETEYNYYEPTSAADTVVSEPVSDQVTPIEGLPTIEEAPEGLDAEATSSTGPMSQDAKANDALPLSASGTEPTSGVSPASEETPPEAPGAPASASGFVPAVRSAWGRLVGGIRRHTLPATSEPSASSENEVGATSGEAPLAEWEPIGSPEPTEATSPMAASDDVEGDDAAERGVVPATESVGHGRASDSETDPGSGEEPVDEPMGEGADDGSTEHDPTASDPAATIAISAATLSIDEDIPESELASKDATGLDTLSDDLPSSQDSADEGDRPAAVDDPNWGTSEFRPAEPNLARRAVLFDLPDPSEATSDPFVTDPDASGTMPRAFDNVPVRGTASTKLQPRYARDSQPRGTRETIGLLTGSEVGMHSQAARPKASDARQAGKRRLRFFGHRGDARPQQESLSEWLGVEEDYDAKKDGRAIGNWDNFDKADGETKADPSEGSGEPPRRGDWKGGATTRSDLHVVEGADPTAEVPPDAQVIEAQSPEEMEQLREAILGMGDDELVSHDVWFVALGASSLRHAGIKEFLAGFRRDIRGSFLVNLDSVGAGDVTLLTSEGAGKTRRADRRMVRMLMGIADDLHIPVKRSRYDWASTDATPAMQASVRAVTVMGMTDDRLPALSHTADDTPENIDQGQVAAVSDMLCELIRRS